MKAIFNSPGRISHLLFKREVIIILILIIVGSSIDIAHYELTQSKTNTSHLNASHGTVTINESSNSTNEYNPSLITPNSIVDALNAQRVAKGLSKLDWITQLDNAATARANFLVSNNSLSTTLGDPGADISDANYNANGWSLSDLESNQDSNQTLSDIISQFTTGNDSNFGDTTQFSDIGVAVVPYNENNVNSQLIVIYLANQQQGLTQQQVNAYENQLNAAMTNSSGTSSDSTNSSDFTCPVGDIGTYPNCQYMSCPTGYSGTYPYCTPPFTLPPPPTPIPIQIPAPTPLTPMTNSAE